MNLICLDAPLVAVAWQWFFAQNLHVAIPGASRLGLFLTAWLIYLIDRFVDSTSLSAQIARSARQKFCAKHWRVWLTSIVTIAVLDGLVVLCWLDHEILRRGMLLAAVAAVYLAINLRFSKLWQTLPLKESSVGFLFANGTLLALAPRLLLVTPTIDFAAVLFAILCVLNCVSIAAWELDLDQAQRKHSIATRWPHVKGYAQALLIILVSASAVLAFLNPNVWALAICLGASAIFLFALHLLPIDRDERTALADLVLLTPLVFLAAGEIV